eukprot:scaffold58725_cov31-Tisochrysis_lutea.AAC.4
MGIAHTDNSVGQYPHPAPRTHPLAASAASGNAQNQRPSAAAANRCRKFWRELFPRVRSRDSSST